MKRILSIAAVISVCLVLVQCEKPESAYKFEVVSANAPCTGFYNLNGDGLTAFNVTDNLEGSTYYFDYMKELESPSTILVHVDSIASNVANSITIYIYENDKTVKKQTFTPVSSATSSGTVYSISGGSSMTSAARIHRQTDNPAPFTKAPPGAFFTSGKVLQGKSPGAELSAQENDDDRQQACVFRQ